MLSLSSTPLGERAEACDGADERLRATGSLRLLRDSSEGARAPLPTLATPGDVREAVLYLKKKPSGVSVVEALGDAKRRVFEPRKVAAYESWGLVERRGSRIVLSASGWEFARRLAPEAEAYRDLLGAEPVYRAALEWIHRQQAELVTHSDLAAYLSGPQGPLADAGRDGKTLECGIVCFFHLCQAAELGTVTIGKRGQPARLRVEREELSSWVARGRRPRAPAARAHFKPLGAAADEPPREETLAADADAPAARASRPASTKTQAGRALRLYVSCGASASKLVGEIRRTLELVDIESHVCERGGQAGRAVPVREDAAELMRGCGAGLLVITKEDCEDEEGGGAPALKRGVLIEAGAAYVLYTGRVVILHEEGLELPVSLGDLPRFTFRRGGLTWEVGVELLRALKGLRPTETRNET